MITVTGVIHEINGYIGNSWLPCALVLREVRDHIDAVTSVETICRTSELVEWVFRLPNARIDINQLYLGAVHNGHDMVQLVSRLNNGISHVPSIKYFREMFQVSATRCDIKLIMLLVGTYLRLDKHPSSSCTDCFDNVHNICSYYIYGSSRLGITNLVPGLVAIREFIRSFNFDDAALAAAVVGNDEAYKYVCGGEVLVNGVRKSLFAGNDLTPKLPKRGEYGYDYMHEDVFLATRMRLDEYDMSGHVFSKYSVSPVLFIDHDIIWRTLVMTDTNWTNEELLPELIRQTNRLRKTFPEFFTSPTPKD
jgi:hypothetical protein